MNLKIHDLNPIFLDWSGIMKLRLYVNAALLDIGRGNELYELFKRGKAII